MTSKRYQEVIEREKHRKSGIRRWKSELKSFGEEVISLIPDELLPDVTEGTRFDINFPAVRETDLTIELRKIAPKVDTNPVLLLGNRLQNGTGNGGNGEELPTNLKLLTVASVSRRSFLPKR